jgi:hypothetical protein
MYIWLFLSIIFIVLKERCSMFKKVMKVVVSIFMKLLGDKEIQELMIKYLDQAAKSTSTKIDDELVKALKAYVESKSEQKKLK